ncbi:MAG TPA: glycosyltransferase family 25 protein [Bradyrhizobium sp.]|nr:glycosyltransferase family 25 protein [Bradyrhizobium sp.]
MSNETLTKRAPDQAAHIHAPALGAANATVEIVVISLPSASQRRRNIEAMFEGTGLVWSYFDAHNALKHPGLRYDLGEVKRLFGRTLTGPEIAVCSSHVAVLSEFLERGKSDYVLVLEDDVIFDTDFPLDEFAGFCAENGMDYVRLFGKHYAPAVRLGFFFDRSIVRFTTSPAGAQAYLMSKSGARKFLDSYTLIDATVDLAMDEFWKTELPIYSIFPYPIIERYSPTSIPVNEYRGELTGSEKLQRLANRVIAKARKVARNIALRSSDRQMQQKSWRFRQIHTAGAK